MSIQADELSQVLFEAAAKLDAGTMTETERLDLVIDWALDAPVSVLLDARVRLERVPSYYSQTAMGLLDSMLWHRRYFHIDTDEEALGDEVAAMIGPTDDLEE